MDAEKASNRHLIGAILSPLLEYFPKDKAPKRPRGNHFITFTLPIDIADMQVRHYSVFVSEKNQAVFQRILYLYFKDLFCCYVDDKARYCNRIKDCILMFCSDYQITFNHINYESLKKTYYRHLKKQQKKGGKVSLNCPNIFKL